MADSSVMSIQLAGFAGSNVFQPDDAPRYKTGLVAAGSCALGGAAVVLVWKALYAFTDKRNRAPIVQVSRYIHAEFWFEY